MAKKRTLPKLRTKEKSHPKKSISKSRAIHSDEEDENMHGSSLKVGGKYHQEVDEDDSIDDEGSEIGWNSDDEAAYGQLFHKKPTDEDDDDDEEEEIEGGILLSDMLSSSNQTTSQPLTSHQSEDEGEEEPSFSGSEDEDEEDDSENEYAYDDEDDDEGDHDKLLAAIEKYSKPAQPPTPASRSNSKAFQLSTESPFSTLQSNQTISLESLLNSLENPSSSTSTSLTGIDQDTLKSVKTNLRSLNSSVTAPKYTHKVQSERAERGVTYEQTSTDMKKWQTLVRDNQASKSLDLRQDKRSLPSTRTMITSFQPQTEMEKEISMILLNPNSTAQHNEQDIERNEEDELLHSKELTHEEIKEKQKELSKIKSLLFFEQMKRHRINKIKSKTFHRILKKRKLKKKMTSQEYNEMVQKLRKNGELLDEDLDEFGEDEDGEGRGEKESEEEAIRRIKERMDLRHKNTGKWARMALEHGKGSKSLREAYHESVLLGNELTKKAMTLNEDDDPYQEDNFPRRRPEDGDDDDTGRKSKKLRIVDEASESLDHILESGSQDRELNGKYKALFEMDFMKKAREQQQLKAKEEAQKLLREIEQMEEGMSDSESEGEDQQQQKGNQKNQKTKESLAKHKEKLEQARKQMTDLMTGNSMSLANQNGSSSLAVPQPKSSSSEISSSLHNNPWLDSSVATKARDVNAMIGDSSQGKVHQKAKQRNIKNAIIKSDDANSSQDILTLHSHDEKDDKAGKRKKNQKIEVSQTEAGDGAEVDSNVKKDSKAEQQQPTRKPLLMQKSQQDLVNLAFAGPDYEADFEALKEKIIDEELDISDKKRKILSDDKAGWGDWAGPGMVGVSPHVVKKRQRLLKNLDEKKAELRAGRTDSALANVILSEKRIKTTAKYKLADVPHPFKTREEYERSLQMPVGNEWNAEHIVRKNTKPEVMLRVGRIIEPIKLPKQRKAAGASQANHSKK